VEDFVPSSTQTYLSYKSLYWINLLKPYKPNFYGSNLTLV